jgi:hypothetical protein
MMKDPVFSAFSDRSSNPVATAIGANKKVRVSRVSGHTEVLSGVVVLVFDGGTGAAKAEMADVTVLAAIGADQENIAEEKLHGTFSLGTENCRATAVGALCGSIKGQHGTVLFLAWSKRVYTTPGRKVSASKTSEASISRSSGKSRDCFGQRLFASSPDHGLRRAELPIDMRGSAPGA